MHRTLAWWFYLTIWLALPFPALAQGDITVFAGRAYPVYDERLTLRPSAPSIPGIRTSHRMHPVRIGSNDSRNSGAEPNTSDLSSTDSTSQDNDFPMRGSSSMMKIVAEAVASVGSFQTGDIVLI